MIHIMHIVYDRADERFDFCDSAEAQYHLEYDRETDTLSVRMWSPETKQGPWPVVAYFYQPRRYVKDEIYD